MSTPILIFLTDFGVADWYVAAMKGRCLSIAPGTPQIDLTHEVPAGEVRTASFILQRSWQEFPPGAHFVCVVDPGVGTPRAAVAIEARERRFIGPDNGLFDFLAAEPHQVRRIENPGFMAAKPSQTFHGRDIFAPAAAHLAAGAEFGSIGPEHRLNVRPRKQPEAQSGLVEGEIVYFDRFGNAFTNIPADQLCSPLSLWAIFVNERELPVLRTFGDTAEGHALAYPGSSGLIEIAINRGNASRSLGLKLGTKVVARQE